MTFFLRFQKFVLHSNPILVFITISVFLYSLLPVIFGAFFKTQAQLMLNLATLNYQEYSQNYIQRFTFVFSILNFSLFLTLHTHRPNILENFLRNNKWLWTSSEHHLIMNLQIDYSSVTHKIWHYERVTFRMTICTFCSIFLHFHKHYFYTLARDV